MLKAIATNSPLLIETYTRIVHAEKLTDNHLATVYRNADTFFVALKNTITPDAVTWIASEYLPERLILPFLGYSVDMIHEIGDVIVPNVFLEYQKEIESTEITKENRDSFVGRKQFVENFPEQKDYYVEDFGLSLGGILVSGAKDAPSETFHEKLMLAYE